MEHLSSDLRLHIRRRLLTAALPRGTALNMWGSPGGKRCDACDVPITTDEHEVALSFSDHRVRLHLQCWLAWNGERQRLSDSSA
jgi:hypothetical protein